MDLSLFSMENIQKAVDGAKSYGLLDFMFQDLFASQSRTSRKRRSSRNVRSGRSQIWYPITSKTERPTSQNLRQTSSNRRTSANQQNTIRNRRTSGNRRLTVRKSMNWNAPYFK